MVGTKTNSDEVASTYLRKVRKPMVERRRRERMNMSIKHLKDLIADTIKHNVAPLTRVDKADILELAVVHLAHLKQQQQHPQMSVTKATDTSGYSNGYKDCAREVITFLSSNNMVGGAAISDLSGRLHSEHRLKSRKCNFRTSSSRPEAKYSTPVRPHIYTGTTSFTPISITEYSPISQTIPENFDSNESYSTCYTSGSLGSSSGSLGESISYSSMECNSSLTNTDTNHMTSDLITIGDGKENAIGHVINDSVWRPW